MRKALVVGIDFYETLNPLYGCVNDAHLVRKVLERHADGTINFGCVFLAASDEKSRVRRSQLRDAIVELYRDDSEVALFYFAGHGHIDETGGFLCTSGSGRGSDGVSISEILTLANHSRAKNKVISGADGGRPYVKPQYGERNGLGNLSGFLKRTELPVDMQIAPAPLEDPARDT